MNIGLKMMERGIKSVPRDMAKGMVCQSAMRQVQKRIAVDTKKGIYDPVRFKDICLEEFCADTEFMGVIAQAGVGRNELATVIDDAMSKEVDTSLIEPVINPNAGIGRNDPCPCHSGKKYKKCCGR